MSTHATSSTKHGQSKVADLAVSATIEEDVVGLEIAMTYSKSMEIFESDEQLFQEDLTFGDVDTFVIANVVGE